MQPTITIVAGPNGAGKSTSAPALIAEGVPYINADEIAKGLTGESKDIRAGRQLREEWDRLAAIQASFAIETTMASRTLAPRVRELKEAGYAFHLYFFWLPDVEIAVARVAARVQSGGHHIPEDVIRRRYVTGLANFFELYQPLADKWSVFDNSEPGHEVLVARGKSTDAQLLRPDVWHNILEVCGMSGKSDVVREPAAVYITDDARDLERAVQRAVTAAVLAHKRAGNPICGWRDGKVVWVQPEDIDVPDEDVD